MTAPCPEVMVSAGSSATSSSMPHTGPSYSQYWTLFSNDWLCTIPACCKTLFFILFLRLESQTGVFFKGKMSK